MGLTFLVLSAGFAALLFLVAKLLELNCANPLIYESLCENRENWVNCMGETGTRVIKVGCRRGAQVAKEALSHVCNSSWLVSLFVCVCQVYNWLSSLFSVGLCESRMDQTGGERDFCVTITESFCLRHSDFITVFAVKL